MPVLTGNNPSTLAFFIGRQVSTTMRQSCCLVVELDLKQRPGRFFTQNIKFAERKV
jgi:hypothetical protein